MLLKVEYSRSNSSSSSIYDALTINSTTNVITHNQIQHYNINQEASRLKKRLWYILKSVHQSNSEKNHLKTISNNCSQGLMKRNAFSTKNVKWFGYKLCAPTVFPLLWRAKGYCLFIIQLFHCSFEQRKSMKGTKKNFNIPCY